MRTQLSLSPTSGSFDGWRLNSVIDRFYLYNITNLDEIINTIENNNNNNNRPIPRIKQIGPFTYRQDREKININFDINNETVIYDQIKRWSYIRNLSINSKTVEELNSTWINHVNIPLAGTTLNPEYSEFIDPIVQEFDLKLFLNHSVNVLLIEGYFDILMEQAKSSGQIDVDRFGWLYNQNNSMTKNIRIFTGPSNATLTKLGSIDQINFTKKLNIWHNNNTQPTNTSNVRCNKFRFSSAGEFFPPPQYSIISHNYNYNNQHHKQEKQSDLKTLNLDISTVNDADDDLLESLDSETNSNDNQMLGENNQKKKTISLFISDLCRSFTLFYNNTYDFKGLSVDRYVANEFTYDYTSEQVNTLSSSKSLLSNQNKCFCIYNENTKMTSCPPNGMMDLFTCKKGSPLTISFPHFTYSTKDPTLTPYLNLFKDESDLNEINGDEYKFFIDLESTLNIPVNAQIVIQFNVHIRNEQSLNFTRDYNFLFDNPKLQSMKTQDLYLPQMWFKSSAEIDEQNLSRLRFIQNRLHLVTPITTIFMFAIASILLMMSAKLAYVLTYGPKSRKPISSNQESCASLNLNDSNYIEEKQKYYAMQLISSGENSNINNDHRGDKPTTSRKLDIEPESQPLNR